ncbi:MAG: hypothetical protein RIQ81_909 [Pseudomonadota bacterium]|jgi:hypothetical protein
MNRFMSSRVPGIPNVLLVGLVMTTVQGCHNGTSTIKSSRAVTDMFGSGDTTAMLKNISPEQAKEMLPLVTVSDLGLAKQPPELKLAVSNIGRFFRPGANFAVIGPFIEMKSGNGRYDQMGVRLPLLKPADLSRVDLAILLSRKEDFNLVSISDPSAAIQTLNGASFVNVRLDDIHSRNGAADPLSLAVVATTKQPGAAGLSLTVPKNQPSTQTASWFGTLIWCGTPPLSRQPEQPTSINACKWPWNILAFCAEGNPSQNGGGSAANPSNPNPDDGDASGPCSDPTKGYCNGPPKPPCTGALTADCLPPNTNPSGGGPDKSEEHTQPPPWWNTSCDHPSCMNQNAGSGAGSDSNPADSDQMNAYLQKQIEEECEHITNNPQAKEACLSRLTGNGKTEGPATTPDPGPASEPASEPEEPAKEPAPLGSTDSEPADSKKTPTPEYLDRNSRESPTQ